MTSPNNEQEKKGTFYNDMTTNMESLDIEDPLFIDEDQSEEVLSLRTKVDALEKIIGRQGYKLIQLTEKFERLSSTLGVGSSGINAEVTPHHRISIKDESDYGPDSEFEEGIDDQMVQHDPLYKKGHGHTYSEAANLTLARQRTISITRSAAKVTLCLTIRVIKASELVVEETCDLRAVEFDNLFDLKKIVSEMVEAMKMTVKCCGSRDHEVSAGSGDFNLSLDLKNGHVVIKLEEDAHVAEMTRAPTRLDREVAFPELIYQGWYERNVLKGKDTVYAVEFKFVV